MNEQIKVLDRGYVQLIETWGSEERIIESARMSTGRGFKGWGGCLTCERCRGTGEVLSNSELADMRPGEDKPSRCNLCDATGFVYGLVACGICRETSVPGIKERSSYCPRCGSGADLKHVNGDEKLLAYLYEHAHMTPFEMAGMTIEVQAPIFVFREWHRHRTQGFNEMSARYSPLPDVNYVPTVARLMMNSGGTNKQAGTIKEAGELTVQQAEQFLNGLGKIYQEAQCLYDDTLVNGVPKEIARVHLPVGRYSRMRATANLRNWLAFMTLRCDPAAQWEIRQYAEVVSQLVAQSFPRTHQLWSRK